jgi:hypothetical protein
MSDPNAPRWDGGPGFYEVWYLTFTDRASGVGAWIRYTLLSPTDGRGDPTASLWFLVMDPRGEPFARKATVPASALELSASPFRVAIGDARLDDRGMRGRFEDVAWDLRWDRPGGSHAHVHPVLERLGIAKTVLTLPHGDLDVHGTLRWADRELTLDDARGGQAHLFGTKHAQRWAWIHANDLETREGERRPGDVVDAVSVFVPRFGGERGPFTPVVGRIGGVPLRSASPARVVGNRSRFTLTGWRFEAGAGRGRRIVGEVDAPREHLAGVTYEDPDGDRAYCYNTEIATLRLHVLERGEYVETLVAPGRAHFEYAQREPLPDVPLLLA